ncbi:MAG: octaprenyl diphosphate synthase, partial [Gammaproteobacteria bacterium]|nr:octaprenyl diphosphate synthase [Gammaproteobacteria bacterium]
ANDKQRELIRGAIESGDRGELENVMRVVESTGAIPYTARLAQTEAELAKAALSGLPDSDFRNALLWLAQFSVERTS